MATHRKDINDNTIIEMYLNGASTTDIGRALGVTHRTILLRLKKNNISRRTLSESQWNFKQKEIPEEMLEDIIQNLEENKYISDEIYIRKSNR